MQGWMSAITPSRAPSAGCSGAEYISLWSWNQPHRDIRLIGSYPPTLHSGAEQWKLTLDLPALGGISLSHGC